MKYRTYLLLWLPVTLLLSACAGGVNKVADLRDNHEGVIRFSVEKNYQEVYQTIRESGTLPAQETNAELYDELDEARIWLQQQGTPFNYFVLIDLKKATQHCTSVAYYYYYSAWESTGQEVKGLFADDLVEPGAQCPTADT